MTDPGVPLSTLKADDSSDDEPVSAVSRSNSPTRRVSIFSDDMEGDAHVGDLYQRLPSHAAPTPLDTTMQETEIPKPSATLSGPHPESTPSVRYSGGVRRKPVGTRSATTSPDLYRSSSTWSRTDAKGKPDARPMSIAWDNLHSPWEDRPDVLRSLSNAGAKIAEEEEEGQQQQQQQQTEVKSEKKAPTMAVGSVGSQSSMEEARTAAPAEQRDVESHDDDFDNEIFYSKYKEPPSYCRSKSDIYTSRFSWLSITIFVLSVYSTIMSGIWLAVGFVQPRWAHKISSTGDLIPATATLITALIAKTIELSFVTVFISFIGQVLTRKSIRRQTKGMTLAEMTMRNWVIQPGSLITHWETLPYAALSMLGMLALTATVASMFYTTASDALVSPKLKFGKSEFREMEGYVRTSYANTAYIRESCQSLLQKEDEEFADLSCLTVQFAGQSYRDLLGFMATWEGVQNNKTRGVDKLVNRPAGTTLLYDNTTLHAQWIQTEYSDTEKMFKEHKRIVNNVTMAYPHPGLYAAATNFSLNGILQPADLGGIGEYSVQAAVASPAINVMCVNMKKEELEPLVYTEWPNARTVKTGVGRQRIGKPDWQDDVPAYKWKKDQIADDVWLNKTVVDDIFRWGKKYGRRPPVWQLYPSDFNLLTNSTVAGSDALYMMGKNPTFDGYTMCELRSWMTPYCTSQFDVSGRSGASMKAKCEGSVGRVSYGNDIPPEKLSSPPSTDWRWVADAWRLSMDLNGGTYNNNASNSRIVSQLSLSEPKYSNTLPSMAEALAVFASSTMVISAVDSPFKHTWDYKVDRNILPSPGEKERFQAVLKTQQYTSGHVSEWHKIFYVVFLIVFGINCFCLVYLVFRSGLVTDYTEPQNLFALAINSPPSQQLQGACGAGPVGRDLVVPWRVAYAPSAEHYFFEEANPEPWKGKYAGAGISSGTDAHMMQGETVPARLSSNTGANAGGIWPWKRKAKGQQQQQQSKPSKVAESSYKRLSKIKTRRRWPF